MSAAVLKFPNAKQRQWHAGRYEPQEPEWNIATTPIDNDIRYGLSLMRARARHLAQNSDHARGFLRIVRNNIVGAPGFVLQSQAKLKNGKPDTKLRDLIEHEWKAWGKRGNCEVSGKFSWKTLQRHLIETVARDGEAFVRIISPYRNRWQFALQVIDPEQVDIQYNGEHEGREVRMGVEIDAYRRPVAYWLRAEPRLSYSSYAMGQRFRVPADEMLHLYLPEFVAQTRGTPWLAVAMDRLHQMRGIEDAELQASRASAAKFAAYEANPEFVSAPAERTENGQTLVDANGNPITNDVGSFSQDVAPASMEVVPWGYQLKMLDPQHPNAAIGDLLKWSARSVSTGMGVSYNTLGNDAEGVNYTSLRFFLGVEHDNWMESQDWFESELPEPVAALWTFMQHNVAGTLPKLPRGGAEQLDARKWQPRRWDGPDPAKQAKADADELHNGTTTLTEIAARKGRDLDELVAERIRELVKIREAAEAAGLSLSDVLPSLAASAPVNTAPEMPDDA